MSELTEEQKNTQKTLRDLGFEDLLVQNSKSRLYYYILAFAKDVRTRDNMVVFVSLHGNHEIWVRDAKSFDEEIEINGVRVKRFVSAFNDPKALDVLKELLQIKKNKIGRK